MKIPKITYTLYPTSDIERIALIDASRQKLEASLFKYPIRESLFFCFRYRRGAAYMDIYNTDGFIGLAPDHGYQLILRVSPSEGGYTALEAIRETASEPYISEGHPHAFHIEYGKGLIERHFDEFEKEHEAHLIMIGIPIDHSCSKKTNKPKTTEISENDASIAHQLASDLSKQMDDVAEQILSKLHAILEIQGINNVFKNPTGKIMFNVEISRIQDQLSNVVHSMVEID